MRGRVRCRRAGGVLASRDVVPDTRDVRVVTAPGGGGGVGGGYAFRRSAHGTIGLAGVRFMDR
jgi:hypothetical protein